MPYLVGLETSVPKNYYSQEDLIKKLLSIWGDKFFNQKRLEQLHKNVLVGGRYLALKSEEYDNLKGFGDSNDAFIKVSMELLEECIKNLLDNNDIKAEEINMISSNTVTGISVPSLEARIFNKFNFNENIVRLPIFGLGCLAGTAGLNRVSDYLKAYPKAAAIFMTVELCSLTLQKEDISIPNLIASGLFGDGASAVLMVGNEHPLKEKAKLKWVDSESIMFPETSRVMGWDMVDKGFKIVLSKHVPDIAKEKFPPAFHKFVHKLKIKPEEILFYITHPGGPKVLKALQEGLGLKDEDFEISLKSLKEQGNMSSASVLFILKEFLKNNKNKSGDLGLMTSMGPGFCAEMAIYEYL